MLRVIVIVIVTLVSCSGKATEPATVKPPAATSVPRIATPKSDRAEIAQRAIDTPALQQYFHGRTPLRVVVNRQVNPAWSLSFAGASVEWVDESSEEPRIEFTILRIEDDKAAARLRYAVEGVVMHANFRRGAVGWELVDAEVAEQ